MKWKMIKFLLIEDDIWMLTMAMEHHKSYLEKASITEKWINKENAQEDAEFYKKIIKYLNLEIYTKTKYGKKKL